MLYVLPCVWALGIERRLQCSFFLKSCFRNLPSPVHPYYRLFEFDVWFIYPSQDMRYQSFSPRCLNVFYHPYCQISIMDSLASLLASFKDSTSASFVSTFFLSSVRKFIGRILANMMDSMSDTDLLYLVKRRWRNLCALLHV